MGPFWALRTYRVLLPALATMSGCSPAILEWSELLSSLPSLSVTVAATATSGDCLPIQATLPAVSPAVTTVQFSSAPAGGLAYFTNAACTDSMPSSQMSIPAGTLSASAYVKPISTGTVSASASATGYATALAGMMIDPPAAPYFASLSLTGSTSMTTDGCESLTITALDNTAAAFNVGSAQTITLASTHGDFYSMPTCTTPTGTASIPAGNSSTNVYFKSTVVAAPSTQTVSASGVADGTLAVSVGPGAVSVDQSVVSVASTTAVSGTSVTLTLTAKDSYGNALITGGQSVVFSTVGAGTSSGTISPPTATDNGNGTYSATFTAVGAGTAKQITATIGGTAVTTILPTIAVSPGAADHLSFSVQPAASGNADTALGTQPTVIAQDAAGNIDPTFSGSIVLTPYADGTCSASAVVGGTNATNNVSVPAAGGVAGFSGVTITKTNVIRLKATSGVLASTCSNAMAISPGAPSTATSLVSLSSSSIMSGATSTLTLTAKDQYGNAITTGGATVAFQVANGTIGTISPATANDALDGTYTATFTGAIAGSTTITATIGGSPVASNQPITVTPSVTPSLTFSTISVTLNTVASGATSVVTLTTRDDGGNPLSSGGLTVAFTVSTGAGISTGEIPTVIDNNDGTYTGIFTGMLAGTAATVGATIDALPISSTQLITVTPGAATQLVFQTQPAGSNADVDLPTQPVVVAKDAAGNIDTTFTNVITLTAHTDSTCSLTALATGVNGVASADLTAATGTAAFSGLRVTDTSAIRLKAKDGSLSICSGPISVSAGAVSLSQTTVSVTDSTLTAGTGTTLTLTKKDAYGNTINTGGDTVIFSMGPGGSSDGTIANSVIYGGNGTYTDTFNAVTAGTPREIKATIGALEVVSTPPTIAVTPAAATQLFIVQQPLAGPNADFALAQSPIVEARDDYGNVDTNYTADVRLTAYSDACISQVGGALNGSDYYDILAVAGVANFTGTQVNKTSVTHLGISSGILPQPCTTPAITITPAAASSLTSTLTAAPASVEANGLDYATLTATLFDAYNNPITTTPTLSGSSVGYNLSLLDQTGNISTFKVTSNTPGPVEFSYSNPFLISPTTTVTFTPPVSVPILAFSDAPSYNFGLRAVGSWNDKVIYVGNTSAIETATITAASVTGTGFQFKGGIYPGFGGTCEATLAPLANCIVVITFNPTLALPPYNGFVTLTHSYAGYTNQPATLNLAGEGTNTAQLVITDNPANMYATYGLPADPALFSFGMVGVSKNFGHIFSVTNQGGSIAFLDGFSNMSPNYIISIHECGATLAPGASCRVLVRFNPVSTSAPDAFTDTLRMGYNGGSSADRPLAGGGTTNAVIRVYDHLIDDESALNIGASYDFGTWGVSPVFNDHHFLVMNTGAMDAMAMGGSTTGSGFTMPGGYPGDLPGTPVRDGISICGTSLPAGGKCFVRVRFSTGMIGLQTGSVTLTDSLSTSTSSRNLKATATASPLLVISGAFGGGDGLSYDFGLRPTNQLSEMIFRVSNVGGAMATSIMPVAPASGEYNFAGGLFPGGSGSENVNGSPVPYCLPPPFSLNQSQSCLVKVTFYPFINGPVNDIWRLNYNGGSASKAITGTGTNLAILKLSDCHGCGGGDHGGNGLQRDYDFGALAAGSPRDQYFVLTNDGASIATISAPMISGPGFNWTGGSYPGGFGTANDVPSQSGQVSLPFCTGSLGLNSSCVMKVTYTPTGDTSPIGNMYLNFSNATITNHTLELRGTSSTQAILSIAECLSCNYGSNPGPMDWGTVGVVSPRFFVVRNSGNSSAVLGMASIVGSGASQFRWDKNGETFPGVDFSPGFVNIEGQNIPRCEAFLAGNTSCAIAIKFIPMGASTYQATLSINASGAMTPYVSRDLRATSINTPMVILADCGDCGQNMSTYEWGTWGINISRTFLLKNIGVGTANLSTSSFSDPTFRWSSENLNVYPGVVFTQNVWVDGSYIPVSPCSVSLPSGAMCVVKIDFTPGMIGNGVANSTLSINWLSGPTTTKAFRGTATTNAVMAISDTRALADNDCPNFLCERFIGGAPMTTAPEKVFTATNIGGGPLMFNSGLTIGGSELYYPPLSPDFPGTVAPSVMFEGNPLTMCTQGQMLNPGDMCGFLLDVYFPPGSVINDLRIDFNGGDWGQRQFRINGM